jgi:hypothetical protein
MNETYGEEPKRYNKGIEHSIPISPQRNISLNDDKVKSPKGNVEEPVENVNDMEIDDNFDKFHANLRKKIDCEGDHAIGVCY